MDTPEPHIVIPRTYWLDGRAWPILFSVWALLMIASDWWPIVFGGKKPSLSTFLFSIADVLTPAIFSFMAFRSFVRLSQDSIKVSRVRGSKVLPFDKIKGRRRYTEKANPYSTPARHLVLEPIEDSFPRLDIRVSSLFDEDFYRWFDSLPDLDNADGIEEPKSKYANFGLV